jgi:hypothetical protein
MTRKAIKPELYCGKAGHRNQQSQNMVIPAIPEACRSWTSKNDRARLLKSGIKKLGAENAGYDTMKKGADFSEATWKG